MLTIDDLRSSAVALDWHEAVAVAAALAGLVVGAPLTIGCPAPADVALLPSGDLRVSGRDVVGTSPAQGLALVLDRLLETAPCPAELRQLVETYQDEDFAARAGDGAVTRFAASLAFFERPGRAEVLAALAGRAQPALERAQRAAALEELTERTRQAAAAAGKASKTTPVAAAHGTPAVPVVRKPIDLPPAPTPDAAREADANRFLIPAIGVVVFLTMAYAAASYFAPAPPAAARDADVPPPDEDLPVTGPGLGQPAKPGSHAPGAAPATTGRKPAPSTTPASAPTTAHRDPGPATTVAIPPTASPAPPPADPAHAPPVPARTGVDVAVAERDGRVLQPATPPVRPVPRVAVGRVFTLGDPRVTPAVLIRPQLPEQPPSDVPDEQIGTLEFVVGESGAVEHVHLVSPANRYQERMLVAAAKTWTFQPATRDGRPVRFRTRIRVTL